MQVIPVHFPHHYSSFQCHMILQKSMLIWCSEMIGTY